MKAFPQPTKYASMSGMDLRDYFAAKAMQSMLTAGDCDFHPITEIPLVAYKIADAMIAARTPPQPQPCSVEEAFGLNK